MEYAFLLQEGGLLYAITDGTYVFLSFQSQSTYILYTHSQYVHASAE
jgi:hypothetical protein